MTEPKDGDITKALMASAVENVEELKYWLGEFMAVTVVTDMEKAGLEIEDIPGELEAYARWMRENLELFK